MSFHDKYFAIPVDMLNATRFWGAQAGSAADGVDTTCQALIAPATETATCNGDGNGVVTVPEGYRGWQHLANAGLIEENFEGMGVDPSNFNQAVPVYNVPQLRISLVGAKLLTSSNLAVESGSWFKTSRRLRFSIGKKHTTLETRAGFLLPSEAWNIDQKMDDGKAKLRKSAINEWF